MINLSLITPTAVLLCKASISAAQCIADEALNTEFAQIINQDTTSTTYDIEGSCCQAEICGLGCPEEVSPPTRGFGIVIMCAIALFVVVGFASIMVVKGKEVNYFVAGRSLPLWVVTATLASQSLDSNAILGNVDLSYKYHFYDGAVLPIGLGLSLILNGMFLASKINQDNALTLPDVFAKRYGKVVEILASICTLISFLMLLAGNLVGMATIISYVLDISQQGAIWISAALVLLYTIAGGLFSVAYTDVLQASVGWIGCLAFVFYMIRNSESAAPPSIGYPLYSYPDQETCDLYDGIPCDNDSSACCYNAEKHCPDGPGSSGCVMDNGAYPIGDLPVFPNQMTDPHALTPFPNAIVWDWATIFILGFGNLAALDFQARCMASKTPKIATIGCLLAGCLTFLVGVPFSYLGAITRTYYGPDTPRAEFVTDTCSIALGLPTCGLWSPDPLAFIKLLTHEAPSFLGGWCLVGIIAASMSTCDGAILAMGTVFSHNIVRNLGDFVPGFSTGLITDNNLLTVARIASAPLTVIAALIAAYYKSSHSAGATGYLLIVAFDVVLASVVVPLFGCFYTKKPSPLAALLAILSGSLVRVVLEFTLPKDGFLLAPFGGDEFLDYGSAASSLFPAFWDVPEGDKWDSSAEECEQARFNDLTGVDSLVAPLVGLVVFVLVQFLERNGPLIDFKEGGLMCGYLKDFQKAELDDKKEVSKDKSFEDDPDVTTPHNDFNIEDE